MVSKKFVIAEPSQIDPETEGVGNEITRHHADNKPYTVHLDPFQLKVWPPKEGEDLPHFTLSKVYRTKDGTNDERKIQIFRLVEANRLSQAIRYLDMVVELFLVHDIRRWHEDR